MPPPSLLHSVDSLARSHAGAGRSLRRSSGSGPSQLAAAAASGRSDVASSLPWTARCGTPLLTTASNEHHSCASKSCRSQPALAHVQFAARWRSARPSPCAETTSPEGTQPSQNCSKALRTPTRRAALGSEGYSGSNSGFGVFRALRSAIFTSRLDHSKNTCATSRKYLVQRVAR